MNTWVLLLTFVSSVGISTQHIDGFKREGDCHLMNLKIIAESAKSSKDFPKGVEVFGSCIEKVESK